MPAPQELDEAARRRMPKQLYIPLPCAAARQAMVERQLGPDSSVQSALSEADMRKIVEKTAGYSGMRPCHCAPDSACVACTGISTASCLLLGSFWQFPLTVVNTSAEIPFLACSAWAGLSWGAAGSDMRALVQEACQGPVRDAVAMHAEKLATLSEADLRPLNIRDFQVAILMHAVGRKHPVVEYTS